MPKIIFISANDTEHVVNVADGINAMEAATQNLVPGIDADCGGAAACGTCHVYVDPAWIGKTGGACAGIEQDMLSLTDNVQENSRLSCQIRITEALDGLVLRIPENQH
ncbi:2Fe-2S iron-sulfur cluster-binding protein [Rhodoferax ferrireducens]|uniref:2Fe-2S iron-sulfur cluster-binding protein n=1 Tax=Rhodoferax ferrireducens TaxID=192843 RepID=UPI000E0D3DC6|nr:2Fe-2S iron-sulfur cluster-binding protein [Rhodoferax ferrireducens]